MAKILKFFQFLAAPKTHFKSIFRSGGDKSDICGLGHSGSQPFKWATSNSTLTASSA